MLDFAAPAHKFLTLLLMALYLFLAIRFFRSKTDEVSKLDQILVHVARYSLLFVYIAGLVLNISLGKFVSQMHHLLSIFPAVLVVGTKYVPILTRKPNTLKFYAWVFTLLFILMIALGLTARITMLPKF